ncbi:MAG: hypothetical protein COB81_08495 [Flavobacteriaceae bacterium]|nr:MAG: hypothetical protein COB81_08495 [Flavobacteriaceae bacterium]
MNKKLRYSLAILYFLGISYGQSQTIHSKLVDATTKEAIPYASILLSSTKGIISNGDGQFTMHIKKTITEKDSLFISYMGYESKAIPLLHFKDSIILLEQKSIVLNSVMISSKNYTPDEIMDNVKENLSKNYTTDLTKKRLFFRQSYHQDFNKLEYTLIKSSIEALNKNLLDSLLQSIPRKESHYTEILCDLYGGVKQQKQKIKLIKACRLYDKNSDVDLESIGEKFEKILKDNVKSNSYFKIKSGLFGTKLEAEKLFNSPKDSANALALEKEIAAKNKREEQRKLSFSSSKASNLSKLFGELFFVKDSKLNFVQKSNRYDFTLESFTYAGDNPVYILSFKPKWGADYKGTLYINADDFAIVRVDYSNVKPLKSIALIGISYKEHIDKGKLFFAKGKNKKYQLRYLEKEKGGIAGVKRPLKIIEKNKHVKGRRKQNELSLKIDLAITNINKAEIVIFDSEDISTTGFDAFKEKNELLPTYLPAYDPDFWKDYTIIAPNEAIKAFTVKTTPVL